MTPGWVLRQMLGELALLLLLLLCICCCAMRGQLVSSQQRHMCADECDRTGEALELARNARCCRSANAILLYSCDGG